MTPLKIEISVTPNEIAILIKDFPHVLLRRQDLVAIQTYFKTTGVRDPLYFIEFTMRDGSVVVSDYNDRGLWEKILIALREARLFEHMLGSAPLPGSA